MIMAMVLQLLSRRWEQRKVEIYRDGRMGFANKEQEYFGSTLGLAQVPSIEEIAAQPEFEPSAMGREEFETVWNESLKQAQKKDVGS
jgi:hypothetical protein